MRPEVCTGGFTSDVIAQLGKAVLHALHQLEELGIQCPGVLIAQLLDE